MNAPSRSPRTRPWFAIAFLATGCAQQIAAVDSAVPVSDAADDFARTDVTADLARPADSGVTHTGPACASATIDSAGGSVECSAVSLTVPPGAVTTPVTVNAWSDDAPSPAGYTRVSPHVAFEPAGTPLASPATISIFYTGTAVPSLFWSRPDHTGYDRLPTMLLDAHATALVTSLGDGFLATTACGTTCTPGCMQLGCTQVIDISVSSGNACALFADGRVTCWGRFSSDEYAMLPPTIVPGIANAVQIASSRMGACAVTADARLFCWGATSFAFDPDGGAAPLADGGFSFAYSATPVPGLPPVAQVSLGEDGGCVRDTSGGVSCWQSTSPSAPSLQMIPGLTGTLAVSGTANGGCAIAADRTVQCWGYVTAASDGDASVFHTQPVTIPGVTNAVELGSYTPNCARIADGTVRCWGGNNVGELGDGTQNASTAGVMVSGIASATSLGFGYATGCVALSDGTAWCWGDDYYLELGDGAEHAACTSAIPCSVVPVRVAGLVDVAKVSVGQFSACALGTDGTVNCWGFDFNGADRSNGFLIDHATPVRVAF